MTRMIHGTDYMGISHAGKHGQWKKGSIILPADSHEDAEELADRLLNKGATEVIMFQWDTKAEGWVPVPFTK